jgi:hypothetical protein
MNNLNIKDILQFKSLVTPIFVQIIFWVLTAMVVISAVSAIFHGQILTGIVALIIGPLVARIFCETMIVVFRIHDNVAAIKGIAEKKQS